MNIEIIGSGSDGNATVIDGRILIDCGMPYKAIEPYIKGLQAVLLTHVHTDHFKKSTVSALAKARPTLWWVCCDWMVNKLLDAGVDSKRIVVVSPGTFAKFAEPLNVSVWPVKTVHNVPNCAWHIFLGNNERAFYATDCSTLDGIEAKEYDVYMIECNHSRAEIEQKIKEKRGAGEYAYEYEAMKNHLSKEQALEWYVENAGPRSLFYPMHQHKERVNDNERDSESEADGAGAENAARVHGSYAR